MQSDNTRKQKSVLDCLGVGIPYVTVERPSMPDVTEDETSKEKDSQMINVSFTTCLVGVFNE